MKRRVLLATTLIVLVGIALFVMLAPSYRGGKSPVPQALFDSRMFVEACWSYKRIVPGDKFPSKLDDLLVRTPEGIGPFMDMRNDKCNDLWGNPYKYALVPNEKGELEPYVWAERIEDGKAKLYGAKCSADGTVIQFGRPDRD